MTLPQHNALPGSPGQNGPEQLAGTGPPLSRRCYELTNLEQIAPLLDRVENELTANAYSEKERFGIRLSLEEALANAIRHGHKFDPVKMVRFSCTVTSERLLAEIEDQGPGFNPDGLPDPLDPDNLEKPSGRGVFLMRAYMTSVQFNDRGNRVTLCKMRSG